jgi:hypothetical protein
MKSKIHCRHFYFACTESIDFPAIGRLEHGLSISILAPGIQPLSLEPQGRESAVTRCAGTCALFKNVNCRARAAKLHWGRASSRASDHFGHTFVAPMIAGCITDSGGAIAVHLVAMFNKKGSI